VTRIGSGVGVKGELRGDGVITGRWLGYVWILSCPKSGCQERVPGAGASRTGVHQVLDPVVRWPASLIHEEVLWRDTGLDLAKEPGRRDTLDTQWNHNMK
jgi:hypothetical protein